MKVYRIGKTSYVGWHPLMIIEVPLQLFVDGFDWLWGQVECYSLFIRGTCHHGYVVERIVTKRPFGKPVFSDKTACPYHVVGEPIEG